MVRPSPPSWAMRLLLCALRSPHKATAPFCPLWCGPAHQDAFRGDPQADVDSVTWRLQAVGSFRPPSTLPHSGTVHTGDRLIPPCWEAFVCATQLPKKALPWWGKKVRGKEEKRQRNEIFREKGSEDTLQRLIENGLPGK